MKKIFLLLIIAFVSFFDIKAQDNFNYKLVLDPVVVDNLPGLHSYAFAQHEGKWLVIGGRRDGLHARQPFNAFPVSQNNTEIFVIDVENNQFWTSSVNVLPTTIKEQMQSTNMNFYQEDDTLYFIGGYAFSATQNDHITFPYLTTIQVSSLIDAVINQGNIIPYFKQINDNNFALTGGQLGKIANTFYLVGGHRFDGRYNPMGNPTYTQTYSNQIRKFKINNSGSSLSYSDYNAITDPVHLRRRDYNLLPQIFPDGAKGYTISSGVFQANADLPFLYPVDISANSYQPITSFNQYLSNYHGAKVCVYDSLNNEMHSLFFGGMSQYYYQNGSLIKDDNVPFVKTISRLTRYADSTLQEFQLPQEMPSLKGASSEFIINKSLPQYDFKVVKLSEINTDTIILGHIYGGIQSPTLNPFSSNQTNTTSADPSIYKVKLVKEKPSGVYLIDGKNPHSINVFPNPVKNQIRIDFNLTDYANVRYFLSDMNGKIISEGVFHKTKKGSNSELLNINSDIPSQILLLTVIFDDKYYLTKKILKE